MLKTMAVASLGLSTFFGSCLTAQAQTTNPTHHLVIAAVGDSAASGEGNPDVPVQYGPSLNPLGPAIWADGTGPWRNVPGTSRCHRSHYAPGAQAADRIRSEHSDTAVTLYLRACTGATIGLPIAQELANGGDVTQDDTAIKQVSHLPAGHIDALIIMVGVNELVGGYGNLLETCALDNLLHELSSASPSCPADPVLNSRLTADLQSLTKKYADLASAIQTRGDIGKVYISEYFDPTHHSDGTYGTVASNAACSQGLLTAESWQWGHDHVVLPLNGAEAAAATAHGWQYVGGIARQFLHHGYCAWTEGQNWVVAASGSPFFLQSFVIQGDINGTAHANHAGQMVYRDALAEAIDRGTRPTTMATTGGYTSGSKWIISLQSR